MRYIHFADTIYLPCGKCDIADLQLRYDINPLTPRRAYRIEDTSHRLSGISQIPQGIYIAANKKLPSEEGSFLLAISP